MSGVDTRALDLDKDGGTCCVLAKELNNEKARVVCANFRRSVKLIGLRRARDSLALGLIICKVCQGAGAGSTCIVCSHTSTSCGHDVTGSSVCRNPYPCPPFA